MDEVTQQPFLPRFIHEVPGYTRIAVRRPEIAAGQFVWVGLALIDPQVPHRLGTPRRTKLITTETVAKDAWALGLPTHAFGVANAISQNDDSDLGIAMLIA